MKVLFVRHAESVNNVLLGDINEAIAAGRISRDEGMKKWYKTRHPDAPLTDKGSEQARRLGLYYSHVFEEGEYLAYTSAMDRTCATLWPLAQAVGQRMTVRVHPLTYEAGGIFTSTDPAVKCESRTAQEIAEKFPGYDVSQLPQQGPWYTQGFETFAECRERAAATAKWLRSEELRKEVGDRTLILMAHQNFLSFLFCALMGLSHKAFSYPIDNTETAYASISREHVRFSWIGKSDHITRHQSPRDGMFPKL